MVWKALLTCCLLLPGLLRAAAGAPVQVFTSELPPMAMAASAHGPGAMHEMVTELGRRTGIEFAVRFVPWRRAMLLSASSPRTAIFPLTRSAEREPGYRWLAPLYEETFLFLSLKGGSFNSAAPARSKHSRVGAVRGSLMAGFIKRQGYQLVEASSVDEALRLLQRGIVDAVIAPQDILVASLRGRHPERYVMSAPIHEATSWLAGTRDFSEAEAALLQHAMRQMKTDGTCAKILRKYQLRNVQ